jgi:hypothetical protein
VRLVRPTVVNQSGGGRKSSSAGEVRKKGGGNEVQWAVAGSIGTVSTSTRPYLPG